MEILALYDEFSTEVNPDKFFDVIYSLGKSAIDEVQTKQMRKIKFSSLLRDHIGEHIHGEIWADNIKETLRKLDVLQSPIHIISSNMHSVMNIIFCKFAFQTELKQQTKFDIWQKLSDPANIDLRLKVIHMAEKNGMTYVKDESGCSIDVQIFDLSKIDPKKTEVIIVMDYAFGHQAYELFDELLRSYSQSQYLDVRSISIMGKAGILNGNIGDIILPTAHIFEGTLDNYPIANDLTSSDFKDSDMNVVEGPMITVLGSSLQNKDILQYFHDSTWNVVGLEMEGAHYQKAIQSASRVRKSISKDVKVRYGYYATTNPLKFEKTLSEEDDLLQRNGIFPMYTITEKILTQILL